VVGALHQHIRRSFLKCISDFVARATWWVQWQQLAKMQATCCLATSLCVCVSMSVSMSVSVSVSVSVCMSGLCLATVSLSVCMCE
jgi:hypothetical protein